MARDADGEAGKDAIEKSKMKRSMSHGKEGSTPSKSEASQRK